MKRGFFLKAIDAANTMTTPLEFVEYKDGEKQQASNGFDFQKSATKESGFRSD